MNTPEIVQQFASQHPIYYGALAMGVGAIGPKVLDYALTDGVDFVVLKVLALQKRALIARGASPEEIKAIELKEAQALARAADGVKKDAEGPAA